MSGFPGLFEGSKLVYASSGLLKGKKSFAIIPETICAVKGKN